MVARKSWPNRDWVRRLLPISDRWHRDIRCVYIIQSHIRSMLTFYCAKFRTRRADWRRYPLDNKLASYRLWDRSGAGILQHPTSGSQLLWSHSIDLVWPFTSNLEHTRPKQCRWLDHTRPCSWFRLTWAARLRYHYDDIRRWLRTWLALLWQWGAYRHNSKA